jgi:3-oxoacyl-[acyl-carrier protein] reductase
MSLAGKVALITGASRGIGQAIMLKLASSGAYVVGTATSETGKEAINKVLKENNLIGEGAVLDVANPSSVESLIKHLQATEKQALILVNNAGITRDNLMMRMSEEDWLAVVNTNLSSVYRLSKACIRPMMKAEWGRIINIGSVVGTSGNPGQANYCAAKAGVIGFTKSLAQEIGSRNITVNVVAPGFIETDMTNELKPEYRDILIERIPLKRIGKPNDIAAIVNFLASDDANYITGQTLHVNGGMAMV